MKYIYFYKYQINNKFVIKLGIAEDSCKTSGKAASKTAICGVFLNTVKAPKGYDKKETPLIKKAALQFGEYFKGKLKSFNLPLTMQGTDFQMKVWNALKNIPYGKTISYGELAAMIGNPKACRAVGMANNRNPIAIIVPCHRVIGHDGSLTGYGGGLELKQKLLELEKSASHAGRQALSKK
jgi:methylated-DNA-[protein]-cysteine S-methyltransferase